MRMPAWISYQQFSTPGWFAPLTMTGIGRLGQFPGTVDQAGVSSYARSVGDCAIQQLGSGYRYQLITAIPNLIPPSAGVLVFNTSTGKLVGTRTFSGAGLPVYGSSWICNDLVSDIRRNIVPTAPYTGYQAPAPTGTATPTTKTTTSFSSPLSTLTQQALAAKQAALDYIAAQTATRLPTSTDSRVPATIQPTTSQVIQQQVAEQAGVVDTGYVRATESWFESVPTWVWIAAAGVGVVLLMKGGK